MENQIEIQELPEPNNPLLEAAKEELLELEREIEWRMSQDPLAFCEFNPAQLRSIAAFKKQPKMQFNVMGNGTGKTFGMGAIQSAIQFPTANPLFHHPVFQKWPYQKNLRMISSTNIVADDGPFQEAISLTWPKGKYHQARGVGHGYNSMIRTNTGFYMDVMTYLQPRKQFAGANKGAVFYSEPPPAKILGECLGRTRAGGVHYLEFTPLDEATHLKYDYIDKGGLFDEKGIKVGSIETVFGEIHDNCRDCHEGGQLPHEEIMATIASWPIEEREARRTGIFMATFGIIYQCYGQDNEWERLPQYHQQKFDSGDYTLYCIMDPHDSKPFAIAWFAVFPNEDVVCLAEFPEEAFESMNVPPTGIDPYRHIIIETERALGKKADFRLIDPNFGNSPTFANGPTPQFLFSEPCEECARRNLKCTHKLSFLFPPDAIEVGHLLVRRLIGNVREGKRPKFYVLKSLRNMCLFMRRYAKKIKDGKVSENKVDYEFKDFPDLPRYGALWGFKYIQAAIRRGVSIYKKRGGGYRGL